MGLKEDVLKQLTTALKAGDKLRTSTIRMLLSAVKYKEIEKRPSEGKRELTDEEVAEVFSTLAKQRRESIEEFKKGKRPDLVEKEEKELEIIKSFLPPGLSEEELLKIIKDTAVELCLSSGRDVGRLMKAVMPKVKGRADGRVVQEIAKKILEG